MPTTKFRRIGENKNYEYVEVTTRFEDIESDISVELIDNELIGLESRIKNLKARRKALMAFIGKNITEGEESFNPSGEMV